MRSVDCFSNNTNFIRNVSFCNYTYIAVAAAHVSCTNVAISIWKNMTVQSRAAGCSVWASHLNFYSICEVFLKAELHALAVSLPYVSKNDAWPLMKVGHLAFRGPLRTICHGFYSSIRWAISARSELWATRKKSQGLNWESSYILQFSQIFLTRRGRTEEKISLNWPMYLKEEGGIH